MSVAIAMTADTADTAEKKTREAAEHHADVVAWDACAKALAPDGIPGELLSEAMGPFNARLAQSAVDTEWMRLIVGQDMAIRTADGRPYQLLSESERWRADAMLAEAISHLSGLQFLLLDRYDVLDAKGRSDALAWLTILADAGELQTCLIFATLREAPADLDPLISAHWIRCGVVEALAEAA